MLLERDVSQGSTVVQSNKGKRGSMIAFLRNNLPKTKEIENGSRKNLTSCG